MEQRICGDSLAAICQHRYEWKGLWCSSTVRLLSTWAWMNECEGLHPFRLNLSYRVLSAVQNEFLVVAPWLLVVFCILRVLRKCWKFRLLHRFNYRHIGEYINDIDLATLVKIPLIICTIIFAASVHGNKCLCPREWEWQVGIVAVFLAWADVVLYMRKLRFLGKYR
jgi:hypothetical protein